MFKEIERQTQINPFELENTKNKNPFVLSSEDKKMVEEDKQYIRESFNIED